MTARRRPNYNQASHRLGELARIIRYRHGSRFDTDDGDIYLVPVAQTLRRIYESKKGLATTEDVLERLQLWAQIWMPLVPEKQLEAAAQEAMHKPKLDKADPLAIRLKLKYADRMALGITTIGACDVDKAGRTRLRKERKRRRDREKKAAKRAERGAIPRAEYLAKSLSRTRPWATEGISRSTWERRRKSKLHNGGRTQADESVSHSKTADESCSPSNLLSVERRTFLIAKQPASGTD